ncbi:MAG: type IV secretory system conjugative DNA transfer family protein, partial [Vicinamibacterales bacterium]
MPPSTNDFEKLGVFYLGRRFDADTRQPTSDLVLYDSKDLVTHALCVGMTGSGKTGLGIALIEEAAIDSVPVIVIDPKGDLTNLALTFPDLSPDDFKPWVNEDDARRAGKDVAAFATDQADRWKKGLAEWGEDG